MNQSSSSHEMPRSVSWALIRDSPASHNRRLYKKRCRIENAFARLKDWRSITMRYTRCGDLFLSAIALAAAILFWLR